MVGMLPVVSFWVNRPIFRTQGRTVNFRECIYYKNTHTKKHARISKMDLSRYFGLEFHFHSFVLCHFFLDLGCPGNRWECIYARCNVAKAITKHVDIWCSRTEEYHQKLQVPKIEVLNISSLFWGLRFPYITLTYSLYR